MARILIVKGPDESFLRLTNVLSLASHEVIQTDAGERALEMAAVVLPDIALVPIVLPQFNGVELASQLRAIPGLASTKIILLGCLPPIGIEQPPLGNLVNGYLNMDVSSEELIDCVETQLKSEQ